MTCSRTGRRPDETVRLTIDSLAFGGDAVGRDAGGRVVFVDGAAPGDEIEAVLTEEKKGFARARLVRVIQPGAGRATPACPLFAPEGAGGGPAGGSGAASSGCGGCQWQHVTLDAQRAAKQDVVARALRHVIARERIAPIATPSPPLGWRRRARLRWFRVNAAGPALAGYRERRSHRVVDVPSCPQLEPALDAALAAVRDVLAPRLIGGGDVSLLLGARGDVHVVLDGAGVRAVFDAAQALLGRAGIRGVILRDRDGEDVAGAPAVDLADGDAPFWLDAAAFAQAAREGNALLRRLVLAAAGDLTGRRVLELFAGSGNFTRDLARAAREVVAVESSVPAATLGQRNVPRASWRGEPAETVVRALADAAERFDLVLVDPPREGLDPAVTRALAALAPPRIIYVSCDPATLARDAQLLVEHGYRAHTATPLDLMPQTFHVEVVLVLERPGT